MVYPENYEKIFEGGGYKILILPDEDPMSPSEWMDEIGSLVCWHRRYSIGDQHGFENPKIFLMEMIAEWAGDVEIESFDIEELVAKFEEHAVLVPVYMYDHSGVRLSTSPFGCPWDSGQVGWAYMPEVEAREVGWAGDDWRERAAEALEERVKLWDCYLSGEVYGYQIIRDDAEKEVVDGCWGFYGAGDVKEEARRALQYLLEKEAGDVDDRLRELREALNSLDKIERKE
jgi:hypothetical protein